MQQQMDWRTALQFASVGVVVVFILRLAGFIGSVWTGLGILAIGYAFVAVAYLPELRKTATVILVLWALVTFGKLALWKSVSPEMQDAVSSRNAKNATRFSETFRGHGDLGLKELAYYCSQTEQKYVAEIQAARLVLDRMALLDPSRAAKEEALQKAVKGLETWRQNCTKEFQYDSESASNHIGSFFGAVASACHPDNSKEWYDLLGVLLFAGMGLYFAAWKEMKWQRAIGGALLLTFFFFGGRYVLFDTDLPRPIRGAWEELTREETPEEKAVRSRVDEEAKKEAALKAPLTIMASDLTPNAFVSIGSRKVIVKIAADERTIQVKVPKCVSRWAYVDMVPPVSGRVVWYKGTHHEEEPLPFDGRLSWTKEVSAFQIEAERDTSLVVSCK